MVAMNFFATAAKGTEGALRDELREIRVPGVRADRGGVHFAGEFADAYRACLWSRIASRVLVLLGEFGAPSSEALYDGVRSIAWARYLTPAQTLAVTATCRSSALTHSQYIAQKTKDAIVDQLREQFGSRPSVAPNDPDVHITVHIARDHARVHLDLAGEPLHRRGYRRDHAEAPLKETLAAAILRLAGWDRERMLVDPMCGSGTFAIEAALWSRNVAPGLARKRFGFERWADYDRSAREVFDLLRDEAQELATIDQPEILASDVNETAVAATRANARAAGVRIAIERRAIASLHPRAPQGFVVTNPPYGERLVGGDALYHSMGDAFARMHGHTIAVLAGTPDIAEVLPSGAREHTVFNGPIECRLFWYEVG
jgi:putative N6-adenine-specific DNA methylase